MPCNEIRDRGAADLVSGGGDGSLGFGELLAHADRGGAPTSVPRGQRPGHTEHLTHRRRESRIHRRKLGIRQLPQLDPPALALAHARTGHLMGDPEGHPLTDQPLGDIRGQGKPLGLSLIHI